MPRVIFLTGAPAAEELRWDETELLNKLLPCFQPGDASVRVDKSRASGFVEGRPCWRSLPIMGRTVPLQASSVNTKPVQPEDFGETQFLDIQQLQHVASPNEQGQKATFQSNVSEDVLESFLYQSLTIHEDVASSQITNVSTEGSVTTPQTQSFEASQDQGQNIVATEKQILDVNLVNLREIPSAKYLDFIRPQRMIVNLVVGIISAPAPRTVVRRKDSRLLELLELIVGDETRSGFGVNLWLGCTVDRSVLRDVALGIRSGDVVLLRNLALDVFRGTVYGSSLRRDMTKVEILSDVRHSVKLDNVRKWLTEFVTPGIGSKRQRDSGGRDENKHGRLKRQMVQLPDDTQ